MTALDHLIVRVSDAVASARFYQQVLGFAHEGRVGPFEVIRVGPDLTLDLLEQPPRDRLHLAFALDGPGFAAVHQRLVERGIAFGGGPFDRDGSGPSPTYGARGMAAALYFHDPDQHNLEIRCYAAG